MAVLSSRTGAFAATLFAVLSFGQQTFALPQAATDNGVVAPGTATTDDLTVTLAQDTDTTGRNVVTISAYVNNTSPTTTYTVFPVDNVLDEIALTRGVYAIKNNATGAILQIPTVNAVRKAITMAELQQFELGPGQGYQMTQALEDPDHPKVNEFFKEGEVYQVQAEGTWKAVFPVPVTQITRKQLNQVNNMGRSPAALTGDFTSNPLTFTKSAASQASPSSQEGY